MLVCRVVCRGVSPVLFSRVPREFKIQRNKHLEKGPLYTPGDFASVHLYRDERGVISLPTLLLRRYLQLGARARLKNGGAGEWVVTGGSKAWRQKFERSFSLHGDFVPLVDPGTYRQVTWKIYHGQFTAPDGSLVEFIRPQVDHWLFSVLVAPHAITIDELQIIFEKTGRMIGLGWQPRNTSSFGRFNIMSTEQTELNVA